MAKAIERVQSRLPIIDNDAWCEDGHFSVISLLYDVTVYTFSVQSNEWHVFNESATRGYICLLNSPEHFDVLDSSQGPSVIPPVAHKHAIDRRNFNTPDAVWQSIQCNYSFQFVHKYTLHKFPNQFGGICILDNPVVAFPAQSREATIRHV